MSKIFPINSPLLFPIKVLFKKMEDAPNILMHFYILSKINEKLIIKLKWLRKISDNKNKKEEYIIRIYL